MTDEKPPRRVRGPRVALWAFRGGLVGAMLAIFGSGLASLSSGPFGSHGLPAFVFGLAYGLVIYALPAAAFGALAGAACALPREPDDPPEEGT